MFDYDDISVQSVPYNKLETQTSTADPAQRVTDDIELVHSTDPSKRRKLDMMVRNNVTKRLGSGKPLSQFKSPKRPEITRLPPIDDTETGTITTVKALGKGSGKDGRPLVADLIRLRENCGSSSS